MDTLERQRTKMVEEQLKARGIKDADVLAAMEKVPRHMFVPENYRPNAYEDRPLPLGPEQTISQPYIVALMLEELRLKSKDKVLEVGTGSGYQAALLAELVAEVYSVEIDSALFDSAKKNLESLGYADVNLMLGDGLQGWRAKAPFDAIIVGASPENIPRELVKQLTPNGRMILPLGTDDQVLVLLERTEEGLQSKELGAVRFVPLKEGH